MRKGISWRERTLAATLVLAVMPGGCGGRAAKPVAATKPFDSELSCDYLAAELSVNQAKAVDLLGERRNASNITAGAIAGAILLPAYLVFVDLSDTEKTEAAALATRNEELLRLGRAKNCSLSAPAPGVEISVEPQRPPIAKNGGRGSRG